MKTKNIINIPQGIYCYNPNDGGLCPYWDKDETKPYQENGYCHFLQKGDWQSNCGILWDGCKECNIFADINEYDYNIYNKFQISIKRLTLFRTIDKKYNFRKKLEILFTGKICRCKFCLKYFLQPKEILITTRCNN